MEHVPLAQLEFVMQRQCQTQWCWAAVASSVCGFFGSPNGPSGTPWKQCEIVNRAHALGVCCQEGASPECNRDGMLDQALEIVSHLAGPATGKAEDIEYIAREIDSGRPVGVRIQWRQGDGHFVVITGYSMTGGVPLVHVDDPWYDPGTYPLEVFLSAYQSGRGYWNDTYPIAV